ncbi:hypothetical protein M409DRAFT_25603 [Zasmidium cellare ATCC 36951]|uniref:FAD-binding PCMH-type domain-containing protein n=1 Tax=Zasmidium cellare ATCC 36951 TaxID=1080233 RepID=A0A6A6CDH6_ZASCE|nr:uncharacterized protein M409DRAFT_25603 [Zasmidium cellare ATCC 36951]KAF2164260.1 hypothetical protein M409DRAFT_25603 [Zasmidium cellare ATCC 36951]
MRLTLTGAVLAGTFTSVLADDLSYCCNALAAAGLAQSIVAPGVQTYESSVQKYFSLAADLRPQCFLQPRDAAEVSLAVKTLAAANKTQPCQFAVRSGGHTSFPGAAGIEDGVTIDLQNLNSTIYHTENSTASVGPGAEWGDVYSALDKLGVMVVGGRSTTIGVGGLTLGGGNSYYAARYGLACDNVARFTVVLGDGSIVTASKDEHPDLFQALKGSSNNLGIVTNFDLMAFDNGQNGTIWGGVVLYPAQNVSDQQFQALQVFGDNISNDPYGSVIVISTFLSDTKTPMFMNAYDYTKPGATRSDAEPTFKDLWLITGNLSDSTGPRNMTSLAYEFEGPKDHRVSFSTLTFKNDIRVMKKAHEAFLKVTETLTADAKGDYGFYCLYQPIPTLFAKHGLDKGGNVLGLDRFNETLILWEAYLKWQGQEQDELFQAQATFLRNEISEYTKSIASDNPWLYLNYADAAQNPLEGYGEANVNKIRAASKKYDPNGVFQYMVPGGFKISAVKEESVDAGKSHAGAIAGGVIGGLAAIVLAVVAGFIWHRKRYTITEPEPRPVPLIADSPPSEKTGKESDST